MKIRIVVDDRLVSVAGVAIPMPELDWQASCFWGEPAKKWDDVAAVQFDLARGMGHIEMITVETDDPDQPNFRAADRPLNRAKFDKLFGWVLPLHAARQAEIETERARLEAEAKTARQAAIDNPAPVIERSGPETVEAVIAATAAFDATMQAVMAEKEAEIAAMRAKQDILEAKVNAMLEEAARFGGGDAA